MQLSQQQPIKSPNRRFTDRCVSSTHVMLPLCMTRPLAVVVRCNNERSRLFSILLSYYNRCLPPPLNQEVLTCQCHSRCLRTESVAAHPGPQGLLFLQSAIEGEPAVMMHAMLFQAGVQNLYICKKHSNTRETKPARHDIFTHHASRAAIYLLSWRSYCRVHSHAMPVSRRHVAHDHIGQQGSICMLHSRTSNLQGQVTKHSPHPLESRH